MAISSFILGSLSTVALYKGFKVMYRCIPYILSPKPIAENTWIITGATDGIGKEYVKYLADRGFNVIAIGRSLSKLNQLKS